MLLAVLFVLVAKLGVLCVPLERFTISIEMVFFLIGFTSFRPNFAFRIAGLMTGFTALAIFETIWPILPTLGLEKIKSIEPITIMSPIIRNILTLVKL